MEKKKDIDIYESEICKDPNELISSLSTIPNPPKNESLLHVDNEFLAEIVEEAEAKLKQKEYEEEKNSFIVPVPPPIAFSTVFPTAPKGSTRDVMNIKVKPGSPPENALSNPTLIDLDNDNLLLAIRENKPTNVVLKAIMEEIAEEAVFIKFWRNENWNTGVDFSEATFKRIKMLKHLVETVVEQEKLKKDSVSGKVDFHGDAFQRVLKYFIETIQLTFRKVHIPEQFEDIFFTELAKSFGNFEKNAERLYYGKD
jgi:hypothetical protein